MVDDNFTEYRQYTLPQHAGFTASEENIAALRESLDSLTKTATASIDKTTDLMNSTTKALSTSYDLMNTANSVLRSVRSQADASTQTTIDSLLDTLGFDRIRSDADRDQLHPLRRQGRGDRP